MVDAKHSRISAPIPPDFEDRHTLALAICEHLGIDPEHVQLGTLVITLGPDNHHVVTWTGHARLHLDDLTGLLIDTHIARDRD